MLPNTFITILNFVEVSIAPHTVLILSIMIGGFIPLFYVLSRISQVSNKKFDLSDALVQLRYTSIIITFVTITTVTIVNLF